VVISFGRTAVRRLRCGVGVLSLLCIGNALSIAQQADHRTSDTGNQTPVNLQPSSPRPPSDIISQNLDRVAATADQILAVLNRDSGLMMEFKSAFARQAGLQGQVLEERDLTDSAIADRLRDDLRLRLLATKLLQRYGYLQPRVNPDSDLAEEKSLLLRQRMQELQRASLVQQNSMPVAPQGLPTCDPRTSVECAAKWQAVLQQQGGAQSPAEPAPPLSEPIPKQNPPGGGNSPILRAQEVPGGFETLLASAKTQDSGPAPLSGASSLNSGRSPVSSIAESPMAPSASPADALAGAAMAGGLGGDKSPDAELASRGNIDHLLRDYKSQLAETQLEPVSMIHRPNPYADVPALYDLYVQAAPSTAPAQRFGLNVFQRGAAKTDLLPMDLPVGPDYVLGPGDSLAIDLWGGVSQRLFRTVDREGRVALPEAGPLLVVGKKLGDVQDQVQRALRTQFRDVSADVSLLKLRTVRAYVVGEVAAPGAYDISSLSTPLNALFSAGGVTPRGSLRRIQHYRGNSLLEEVDAYDLLLRGVRGNLQRIESGDSLRIPPLGPVVTVDGMVRRPAVYELRNEKNLEEVLDLAGGMLPAAALRHVEVQRLVAHEKRVMFSLDLGENSGADSVRERIRQFTIEDGDQIHIFPIAPYNSAAVYLEGHLLRPGKYSYREGMKLTDVITGYRDLLPEPASKYAEIVRLEGPEWKPVVMSFNLGDALADPSKAPQLQPLDTVRIFGRFDFEASPTVLVTGDVQKPGSYRLSGQEHLRDVLYQAGGVTPEAWLDSAQVFRVLRDGTSRVFSVNLRSALDGEALNNLPIEPRDRILINRVPELAQPATVYVQGSVANPGRYPYASNMTVADLIRSAGGLLRSASAENGSIAHYTTADGTAKTEQVAVNLSLALGNEPASDLVLKAGDVLTVPERAGWRDIGASVSVRGEVFHAGTYGIHPGERLSAVIERAGGFTPGAFPYGAVLTRRNVRELEIKSHVQLVERVKMEQVALKGLPENDPDQKNAKLTALAQTRTTLEQLESIAPIGRVVIHIQPEISAWKDTVADPILQDGDVLVIPRRQNYITVTGQVFNPTSISYRPGHSAKWYLSQAGGFTQMANREAAFVVRADGSVIAAKNNSGWWSGDPMNTELRPGDAIVVPERAPRIGSRNWTTVVQMAQIASAVALTAAYIVR
jgi:polysaccharide biosynthesis/export protein